MIRKFAIALGTTALIGATALAPTAASAGWHHHHHGYGYGLGLGLGLVGAAVVLNAAPSCYYVKQPVQTAYGVQIQYVQVCELSKVCDKQTHHG